MTDGKISATGAKPKVSRVEVYWHTVRYRTVALYIFAVVSIVLASAYIVFPAASAKLLQKLSDAFPAHEAGVATI